MAKSLKERQPIRQGSLRLAVLLLVGAPAVTADKGRTAEQDETCFVQVQSEVVSRTLAGSRNALTQEKEKLKLDIPNILTTMWDYEMDAGGIEAQPPSKDGEKTTHHPPHPLWKPEWHRMLEGGALRAGGCLFLAGVLCCAGGIGGGGIYVTVLMVFGALSVHDAIPLSKVVVFAASTPSLILNLAKTITVREESKSQGLIDWNLCRVVIPWALIGTLLGVFLNGHIPGKVIVALLSTILVGILAMIIRTGYQQHCKERLDEEREASIQTCGGTGEVPDNDDVQGIPESSCHAKVIGAEDDDANILGNKEIIIAASMLLTIIYCGSLHFHTERCSLDNSSGEAACHHPIALAITFGQMPNLKPSGVLLTVGLLALIVAITYCFVIGTCCACRIVRKGQVYGSLHKFDTIGQAYAGPIVGLYIFMATVTGCLAGLVGIGGGLIFSPVFIEMKIDPHIAVATSATCVIFTSSSTTFQYLLSDRIIVSLIFSFCIPHLLAAYTGTKLVHYIQDNYGAKKSWITWIVALGVGISCLLAISKLFSKHSITD